MTSSIVLIMLMVAGVPNSILSSGSDSLTQSVQSKSPGRAVLYSFLIPGGGQIYTNNYWKAAIIAPAEVSLGYLSYTEFKKARDALVRQDTVAYSFHRDRRNSFLWWTGAIVVFSMADAYISAHMFGFERDMRLGIGRNSIGIELAMW
ncbi:MAG: DUF5683 domain-containing protein [bacterium]